MPLRNGSNFGPGGMRVILDSKDSDTPAMVYLGSGSATYACAVGTGEVEGTELTDEQMSYLETNQIQAEEFVDRIRVLS